MCRGGRARGVKNVEHPTDFSSVVDLRRHSDSSEEANGCLFVEESAGELCLESALEGELQCLSLTTEHYDHDLMNDINDLEDDTGSPKSRIRPRVYSFPNHRGLFVVRDALSPALQRRLAIDCLTKFPSTPAATNFNRTMGRTLDGIWEASCKNMRLNKSYLSEIQYKENTQELNNADEGHDNRRPDIGKYSSLETRRTRQSLWTTDDSSDGPLAIRLLRKLRWASIGPVFDWTKREYVAEEGKYLPLPCYLKNIASMLAIHCFNLMKSRYTYNKKGNGYPSEGESMPIAVTEDQNTIFKRSFVFHPEAALVNYYSPGDTLGGHIDDAEADLSIPLVSLSVGCPAVFLVGGTSRDQEPIAIWLCSGDAVVLLDEARKCYHGVPRVLSIEEYETLFSSNLKKTDGCCGTSADKHEYFTVKNAANGMLDGLNQSELEEFKPFAEHLLERRINISIRQVSPLQK